ncbi:ABC transporter permease [Demequina sp.]|uniref:ABC transporter permease n=1 Tax=Demequina sp. TaxID=2050685 RepID=UPI0025BCB055|nr:ABC transporter permease [Demequina sp.]
MSMHAVRLGVKRGWHEQILSLKSPQDQVFYVAMSLANVAFLWWKRNDTVEELGLSFPQVALPGILALVLAFGFLMSPAQVIAMEREDGTLLRMQSAPGGGVAYAVGHVVMNLTTIVPMLLVLVVPSVLLFDAGSQRGVGGWLVACAVLVLGASALLPVGLAIGTLAPDLQRAAMWSVVPLGLSALLSGIMVPVASLWGWLQPLAQGLPLYWVGHLLRYAFLTDASAAGELNGSWQVPQGVAILVVWSVVSWVAAAVLLRRSSRRQSGAAVADARVRAAQWVH